VAHRLFAAASILSGVAGRVYSAGGQILTADQFRSSQRFYSSRLTLAATPKIELSKSKNPMAVRGFPVALASS
jgi:hypothetical protein